jgi:hypothetical protein
MTPSVAEKHGDVAHVEPHTFRNVVQLTFHKKNGAAHANVGHPTLDVTHVT